MNCAVCPAPIAASLGFDQPEAAVLCAKHLLDVLKERRRRSQQVEWPKCPVCEQAMYLKRPGACEACKASLRPPTVDVVDGGSIRLKADPEHYTAKPCDEPGCSARMVWLLGCPLDPWAPVRCVKHGAGPEEESHG